MLELGLLKEVFTWARRANTKIGAAVKTRLYRVRLAPGGGGEGVEGGGVDTTIKQGLDGEAGEAGVDKLVGEDGHVL